MTKSSLSLALSADTDHVAFFARDGALHRWQDVVVAATRIAAAVSERRGQRWAIQLDDNFRLAAALLGCWAADKVPVLVATPLPAGNGPSSVKFDGVIESQASAARAAERIVWERIAATKTAAQLRAIKPSAELVLYTSGSTGVPKEVSRRVENVEAELAVLELLWGAGLGDARVHSTVSARHVYGMLFSVLWPLLYRRPVATFRLEYPEQLTEFAEHDHALVSSPALLKRIDHLPPAAKRWRAVFSSGALLPVDAALAAARVLGACPVEVLGSTETSGVAWRRQTPGDPASFQTMPRVETRLDEDGLLEVRSPFSGQPGWQRMGDRVRFVAEGRFELLDRGDHLAKIEDKRVSLIEIERCLLETGWIADVAAVALEHGKRQYIGALVELNADGRVELAARGKRSLDAALKASLRTRIELIALPRKFRYVDSLPTDSQGKRRRNALQKLFEPQ